MFPSLTVFFPAYNDAPSLPGLIRKTFETLAGSVRDYEVIVINDGSYDNTGDVLRSLADTYGPRLRIITHAANLGYGAALRTGFASATKDFVFYTDGDGQYDVGELPKLLAQAGPNVGLVNGYKRERHDPLHRIWIGSVYNAFARQLFGIQIRDIDCDYRLIRRCLIEDLHLTSTSGTICVELVRKIELMPYTVVEVAVHHYPRYHGRSQFFRVRSLLKTFSQLIGLYIQLVLLSSKPKDSRQGIAPV
ncbi:MAG TPA: glycosyltransferase family 2 protein [Bryobacteraceae bacterium]|nr:glycosyltransferase family 2 protein [Bryobacteraceae bacterium]